MRTTLMAGILIVVFAISVAAYMIYLAGKKNKKD